MNYFLDFLVVDGKPLLPIEVTPFGIITFSNFVSQNAYSPIVISVDGYLTFVSDLHPSKQWFPIDVTPSGIITSFAFTFENAPFPIVTIVDGN